MSKCLLKCLTFCSCLFLLLARIAESQNREMFLARIAEIMLGNYSPCETDRRLFGNKNSFSCQSNLPFCVDDEKEIHPKTYRGLPQASHGINNFWWIDAEVISVDTGETFTLVQVFTPKSRLKQLELVNRQYMLKTIDCFLLHRWYASGCINRMFNNGRYTALLRVS